MLIVTQNRALPRPEILCGALPESGHSIWVVECLKRVRNRTEPAQSTADLPARPDVASGVQRCRDQQTGLAAFMRHALNRHLGYGASSNRITYDSGSQLMTPQECAEHRAKMQSMTPAERQNYIKRHHEGMRKLAAQRGLTIPDQPWRGPGMEPGYGYDPGNGRGRCGRGPGYGCGWQPRWRPYW